MNDSKISGGLFAGLVKAGAANLDLNRKTVNDLNVFPIPDGDTGDNMFMTIDSGAASCAADDERPLCDVAAAVATGMLVGARGNSGVILSRIFAGISHGLEGLAECDISELNSAFGQGVKEAYGAVAAPVEGTMLTVWRDAVGYAGERIGNDSTVTTYIYDLVDELCASLERTPDLLDVLKEAGVVDSGGAGLVYIFEGMKKQLSGIVIEGMSGGREKKKAVDTSLFTENSELEFGYCTEFLLRLQVSKVGDTENFDLDGFTAHLTAVGESVVAFRDGSIVKVHVHTMHPGEILNYCQQFGEFLTLKIENMMLQHEETTIQNNYVPVARNVKKEYGTVVVASGDGITDTFRSLGADYVVEGGQSMSPSAGDFIKAFDEICAENIFVFPNNGNVILTAKQAAALAEKYNVYIIPTRTIGEGYAALSMFDTSSDDPEAIAAELGEIAEGVVTGMVSRASRNTERDSVTVRCGDYIGFSSDDTIYSDAADANTAALELAEKLGTGNFDVMLLICGKDAKDARDLYDALTAKYKRTEIIMIDGGQPIYDYIMALE